MKNAPEKSRREEYAEATRRALLDAARTLFTEQGFQHTGVEAIAQAARVTRGAFYHHFDDKQAIYDALVVELQHEAVAAVEQRARAERDPGRRLSTGFEAYLDICLEPAYRRLVILDGAAVLGAERFRDIDDACVERLLTAPLSALKAAGKFDCDHVPLLSKMLSAMTWEVAAQLASASQPAKIRRQATRMIERILAAFMP